MENEEFSRSNFIGILALGWSYIFSAQLIERQRQDNASMAYTSTVAEVRSSKDNAGDLIDIGHVSKEATR